MSRRARSRTSFFGIALLFLTIPLWWSARANSSSAAGTLPSTGGASGSGGIVLPPDFQVILLRSGLDPAALAAAGIVSNGVSPVLQAAADAINGDLTRLPNADTAFAAARVESDRLQRKIQSGLASQEEIAAYPTAASNFTSATSARQAALDAVFNAAVANLAAETRNTLTQIRANRARDFSRDFPTEFLVIERSEAQWVSLRDALANERLAVDYPDLLNETAQSNLTTWRANQSVSAAATRLGTNLASVTSAWNSAAGAQ